MRLIDGDALKYAIDKRMDDSTDESFSEGLSEAMIEIDFMPTIDAVEVVRCKDCIHWFFCRDPLNREQDDFCSDGIRRGDHNA